jgi:hypothetical protein
LQLAFNSEQLRTMCENETAAKNQMGAAASDSLKHRLADLRSATSILDLVAGRPRFLEDTEEQMVIDLDDGYHLLFCANHPNNPLTETGKLNWPRISRVKILRIEQI